MPGTREKTIKKREKREPMMIYLEDGGRLAYYCEACGRLVRTGYVHIDMARVAQTGRAVAEWHARHGEAADDVAVQMSYPEPAHWEVHHTSCDPEPETPGYRIAINRIDTVARLVHWTSLLMGKSWLQYTDWSDVLRTVGEDA